MKDEMREWKEEFRKRTKAYASGIIRLYCSLPKNRREVQASGTFRRCSR